VPPGVDNLLRRTGKTPRRKRSITLSRLSPFCIHRPVSCVCRTPTNGEREQPAFSTSCGPAPIYKERSIIKPQVAFVRPSRRGTHSSYDYLTLVASSSQLFVGHHLENKTSQMYIDPMHRKGPLITAGYRTGNNAFSSVIQDVHLSGQCGIA
jgi:hypothetical protein